MQRDYAMTNKVLLSILECLKQLLGIIFGYKINLSSDSNNLVYVATISDSQRVMHWRRIIKYFRPNIKNIYGGDNIVAYTLIIFLSASIGNNNLIKIRASCRVT